MGLKSKVKRSRWSGLSFAQGRFPDSGIGRTPSGFNKLYSPAQGSSFLATLIGSPELFIGGEEILGKSPRSRR